MSLHLEFEPHSWYRGAAIKDNGKHAIEWNENHTAQVKAPRWAAYYLNGNTGYIIEFEADTLQSLKNKIASRLRTIAYREQEQRAGICNTCGYGKREAYHLNECKAGQGAK